MRKQIGNAQKTENLTKLKMQKVLSEERKRKNSHQTVNDQFANPMKDKNNSTKMMLNEQKVIFKKPQN